MKFDKIKQSLTEKKTFAQLSNDKLQLFRQYEKARGLSDKESTKMWTALVMDQDAPEIFKNYDELKFYMNKRINDVLKVRTTDEPSIYALIHADEYGRDKGLPVLFFKSNVHKDSWRDALDQWIAEKPSERKQYNTGYYTATVWDIKKQKEFKYDLEDMLRVDKMFKAMK